MKPKINSLDWYAERIYANAAMAIDGASPYAVDNAALYVRSLVLHLLIAIKRT